MDKGEEEDEKTVVHLRWYSKGKCGPTAGFPQTPTLALYATRGRGGLTSQNNPSHTALAHSRLHPPLTGLSTYRHALSALLLYTRHNTTIDTQYDTCILAPI